MLIVIFALFVLVKSIQMKKYRLLPMCICTLLYIVALTLWNYPGRVSENYIFLTKWFEHVTFVLLIVSIFYASSAKAEFVRAKMILPRVLACAAVVFRVIRLVFSRYVLSEGYIAALTSENIADIMTRNAQIASFILSVVSWIVFLIMIYFAVMVSKEKAVKQKIEMLTQ